MCTLCVLGGFIIGRRVHKAYGRIKVKKFGE